MLRGRNMDNANIYNLTKLERILMQQGRALGKLGVNSVVVNLRDDGECDIIINSNWYVLRPPAMARALTRLGYDPNSEVWR